MNSQFAIVTRAVAEVTGVPEHMLVCGGRTTGLVSIARHLAIALARDLMDATFAEISDVFGIEAASTRNASASHVLRRNIMPVLVQQEAEVRRVIAARFRGHYVKAMRITVSVSPARRVGHSGSPYCMAKTSALAPMSYDTQDQDAWFRANDRRFREAIARLAEQIQEDAACP